jgi:hypothetical protein
LANVFSMCRSTVRREMVSAAAISPFVIPRAIARATSTRAVPCSWSGRAVRWAPAAARLWPGVRCPASAGLSAGFTARIWLPMSVHSVQG